MPTSSIQAQSIQFRICSGKREVGRKMSSSSSDEAGPSTRSRTTRYRRYGSKKQRRLDANSSSSEHEDGPSRNISVEEEDADMDVDTHDNGDDGEPMGDDLMREIMDQADISVIDQGQESTDSEWSDNLDEVNMLEDLEQPEQPASAEEDDAVADDADFIADVNDPHPEENWDSGSDPEEEEGHFNFTHESLHKILEFQKIRTVKESMLNTLALSIRHKLDYECLLNNFKSQNVLFGQKFFPTSKKELWKILGRKNAGVEVHIYCDGCGYYIGLKRRLGELIQCRVCNLTVRREAAKVFITLCLKSQLKHFLSMPGVYDLLRYRETRIKHDEEAIEDMFDGEHYKSLRVDGQELKNSNNFTWTFNTDGCRMSKGAKTLIQPVYVRLNELPPKLRQKYMFLVGVYVGVKEPNMQSFLKPIIPMLNSLATVGLWWKPDGVTEIRSKFVTICHCVDGKAKWQILNMTPHSGYEACTLCTYRGVFIDNYMRYPWRHENLPPSVLRTDREMRRDMILVTRANPSVPIHGHRGASPLLCLKGLDLVKGNCLDDLHYFYECAACHNTQLLLKTAPRLPEQMGYDALCANIDGRLGKMKTPGCISRKPGNCKMKNLKQMSGTELRNWLLYGAVPCLQGLVQNNYIRHIERLSHGAYLLSMDLIKNDDIDKSERFICAYLEEYDDLYGVDKSRLNLHSLKHGPNSVRLMGALWCYSTFNFESWNFKLLQLISSAKGVLSQIATRHLLHMMLNIVLLIDYDVSQDFKDHISKILMKRRREDGLKVGPHTYLRGAPTLRQPTIEEIEVLHLEGFQCRGNLSVYTKMSARSVDYKVRRVQKINSKSDDTTVFTYQNTFCTIEDIVKFENQDEEEVCGLFVKEHSVVHPSPFSYATHIKQILPEELPHFITIDKVRAPVVKVFVNESTYFIPLPNTTEID